MELLFNFYCENPALQGLAFSSEEPESFFFFFSCHQGFFPQKQVNSNSNKFIQSKAVNKNQNKIQQLLCQNVRPAGFCSEVVGKKAASQPKFPIIILSPSHRLLEHASAVAPSHLRRWQRSERRVPSRAAANTRPKKKLGGGKKKK